MRYLGGKTRIAKDIARIVSPDRVWWEPFCGGLSVSIELASHYKYGFISDVNPALISLYQAVREGWDPPQRFNETQYHEAKLLPDSDPLKAFIGFGCSFGGKWFGGMSRASADQPDRNYCENARNSLLKKLNKLQNCDFECGSFFDVKPSAGLTIYCDPPYEGTTGYGFTFQHDFFWERCREWTAAGSSVFVSEYSCPVPSTVVFEKQQKTTVNKNSEQYKTATEKLFRIK